MSGPVGVKPTRTDADIRADLAELARWVNARDEDPSLLLFALATDVEPLLFRATMAEDRLARVRARLSDPTYVFDEGEDCIRVADVEAALEGSP